LRSSVINGIQATISFRERRFTPVLDDHYCIDASFGFGQKRIKNFSQLPLQWQNVDPSGVNFSAHTYSEFQRVLSKRILFENKISLAMIENNALSRNDLLRLGGLQNLRGYDRNFFFTRSFALTNFNYRYFLDNNSSFFLLNDFAILSSPSIGVYSVGAGLDVRNKNGWFRLIYAIGSEFGQRLELNSGKVHFGYIAIF